MTRKLFNGLSFVILAAFSIALSACGGGGGGGGTSNASTIRGTIDVTKIMAAPIRAVSTTVVGGTVYVYDHTGALLNTPSGTPFTGNTYAVPNVPNGGPYVITVLTGNASLNAYLPNLNGDDNSVNLNPYTTAVVKVIGAQVGVPNLGTAGNYTFNASLITGPYYTGVTTSTGVSTIAGDIEGTVTASFTSTATGTTVLGSVDTGVNGTAAATASAVASSLATGTGTNTGTGTRGNVYDCISTAAGATQTTPSLSCAGYSPTGPITYAGYTLFSSSPATVVASAGTTGWIGYTETLSGTFGQLGCVLSFTAVTTCPATNLLGICKRTDLTGTTADYYYNSNVFGTAASAQATCLSNVYTLSSGGYYPVTSTYTVTSTWSTTP